MKKIVLKKGRESSLLRRHPWVFSGAIAKVEGNPSPGEEVLLVDHGGNGLGVASWSPQSQIQARVWSFDVAETIERGFFKRRLEQAIRRRQPLRSQPGRSACRLVYGESDHLPGLVVDSYNQFLVCQFLTVGAEIWKATIVDLLRELVPCAGIYERSDVASRRKEGLEEATGVLWGEAPPETLVITEYGCQLGVDIAGGHKTGYYLDQAENRHFLASISADKTVLNCFSYSGGFSVAALVGGARHVTSVDSSAPALAMAEQNLARNGFDPRQYTTVDANVFELLRQYRRDGHQYDMVILDPPKFADTRHQQNKAARAYKDIAMQAAPLVAPGGLLMTYSCSGAIDMPLFQKITADGFLDAGRSGQVVRYLHQGQDHPVGLAFPESLYLKGLLCQVD